MEKVKADIEDLIKLDFEKQQLLEKKGEDITYGILGSLWKISKKWIKFHEAKAVNKRQYILCILLLGWMGGHRYYEKRWIMAMLYTMFFWTGVPLSMAIIDVIYVLPQKEDKEGNIYI